MTEYNIDYYKSLVGGIVIKGGKETIGRLVRGVAYRYKNSLSIDNFWLFVDSPSYGANQSYKNHNLILLAGDCEFRTVWTTDLRYVTVAKLGCPLRERFLRNGI